MKISGTMKQIAVFTMIFFMILMTGMFTGCSSQVSDQRNPVRILILPKFETGAMAGDFPGEAQFFFEEYLAGGDTYQINGSPGTIELYYKNGIALCLAGQGKVSAALNTAAVLSDPRFDYSDAYVLSVGCCGVSEGYGILGDVFVISAAADFDLGHRADPRETDSKSETTWFHDESFDESSIIWLNKELTDRVYALTKDIQLHTTEKTEKFLNSEYPKEAWANRQPQIMRGTSVTSDSYWKGRYDHQNALLVTKTYGCSDPYAASEMEDIAVGNALRSFGMLDRLIILRTGVNMDVFPRGITPEILWGSQSNDQIASKDSMESVDIFETAMQNCFSAGKVLIDAVMDGAL